MSNITMTVDDRLIKKVRKVALEKNTTLTALVRECMERVAKQDESRKRTAIRRLRASFKRLSRDMGAQSWRREDLYDR